MRMPSAILRTMSRMRKKADPSRQFSRLEPFALRRRDSDHVFICRRHYSGGMLFLSAFARLIPREPEANDLLAEAHAALGHLGLTIIAIVFVLVTFWKS
jgi:hypothetical protein